MASLDPGIRVVTELGRLIRHSAPSVSSGESAQAVAEVSYGRLFDVGFEVTAELRQADWRAVGADSVLQQFQAVVGGGEGTVGSDSPPGYAWTRSWACTFHRVP